MSLVTGTNLIKETMTPSPDGVEVKFYTSQSYRGNSVSVWLNGIKLIKEFDDGFDETGSNEVTMKETPLTGDSLQAEYQPL